MCMCVYAGNFAKVYEEQLALAGYFTGPGEDWLSLYFHQVALRSAQRVRLDGGRKEAEANANLARVYLEQGSTLTNSSHIYTHTPCTLSPKTQTSHTLQLGLGFSNEIGDALGMRVHLEKI